MCTAISFFTNDHYFGRNLDLEYAYKESVTITPRNFPLSFLKMPAMDHHYAIIGIAYINRNYPLYYDATNEYGLSIAALNFPGNAVYQPYMPTKDNVTPFELTPWLLGQCKTVDEAKKLLGNTNLLDQAFSEELPLTPLHWLLSDRTQSIVLEPTAQGLNIYDNPVRVLTNNPPFPYHLYNLQNYINLTAKTPVNRFSEELLLEPYSRGMGAMGLPGDLSSSSRFVRAAFTLHNSQCNPDQISSITQFFHILGAVAQQEGCVQINGKYEKTVYSSCCNANKGIYYYKTYTNNQITAVDMHKENLNSGQLIEFPLRHDQIICYEN